MRKTANLEISDGLSGYLVQPDGGGPFPAVIVIMEVFGLTAHIKRACERLAEAGFAALAPDIFHGDLFEYNDMDGALGKLKSLRDAQVMAEIGASLDWLSEQQNIDSRNIAIIGFCMGGRLAFLANAEHADRLGAAVCFYGGGISPDGADRFGRTPPFARITEMKAPVFLGYGADDGSITPTEHGRIVTALSTAKLRYTLSVYQGAGHGFLCEERGSYAADVADNAWQDAISFLCTESGRR